MKLIYGTIVARKRARAGKEGKVRIKGLSSHPLTSFLIPFVYFWSNIFVELDFILL